MTPPLAHEDGLMRVEKKRLQQEFTRWKSLSVDVRQKHSTSVNARPWTGRDTTRLRGVPDSRRQHDVIDVCFAVMAKRYPDKSFEDLAANLFCNISQGVDRLPVSFGMQTCACSSAWYWYGRDAVLSGASHLKLLGWPQDCIPDEIFDDKACRQLGGAGFSVPIAAMLTYFYWCNPHAPWW